MPGGALEPGSPGGKRQSHRVGAQMQGRKCPVIDFGHITCTDIIYATRYRYNTPDFAVSSTLFALVSPSILLIIR